MAFKLSTIISRSTVAIACTLVMLSILSTNSASAQGASETDQQLSALRQQVNALDGRLKAVEKQLAANDESWVKLDEWIARVDKNEAAKDESLAKLDEWIARVEKREAVEDESVVKLDEWIARVDKNEAAKDESWVKLDEWIQQIEAKVRSLQSQETASGGSGGSQAAKVGSGGSQATKSQAGLPQVLQGNTVKVPFKVVDAGGKTILTVDTDRGKPKLVIGDSASGSVTLGVGEDGTGKLGITNTAGKVGVIMGQNTKGGYSVAVFGPDAREIEASVGTGPKGGTVRVYPHGGGSAQAELVAASDTGGGAVNVYDLQGEAVGWLEASKSGNGRFTIGRAGKIYVEAGALESGRGFVIAGPEVGGAPPGLVIPYYLEGRLGH